MRRLTISRGKTMFGSTQTIRFYIEDAAAADLVIDGRNCRYLGELGNGEQRDFFVESSAAYIYAMPDAKLKDVLRDQLAIPEGQEDVYISGKFSGNPLSPTFQFDGVGQHFTAVSKKRKILGGALTVFAFVIMLVGVFFSKDKKEIAPKTFRYEDMSITLTDRFTAGEEAGFDVIYDSSAVTISVFREQVEPADIVIFEELTTKDYAGFLLDDWSLDVPIEEKDGLVYFVDREIDATDDAKATLVDYTFVYKSEDAFWVFQFIGRQSVEEKLKGDIFKWANSVEFES